LKDRPQQGRRRCRYTWKNRLSLWSGNESTLPKIRECCLPNIDWIHLWP